MLRVVFMGCVVLIFRKPICFCIKIGAHKNNFVSIKFDSILIFEPHPIKTILGKKSSKDVEGWFFGITTNVHLIDNQECCTLGTSIKRNP